MRHTVSARLSAAILVGCVVLTAAKPAPQGKTYYTKVNIWYENPRRILSTNYHKGGRIPVGSEVKILSRGDGRITFFDSATGVMTLWHARRHSRITSEALFDRHFSETNPRAPGGEFSKLTKEEQQNVDTGTIANGMGKDAVLMAYGYPPSHRTPSTEQATWTYWVESRKTKRVNFNRQGKVGENKIEEEKEAPAELDPIGKEYFTKVGIWHDGSRDILSLNYHSGTRIPVGSRVKIVSFGNGRIAFEGAEMGAYTIVHNRRYRNVTLHELFSQYFSETDLDAKDSALAKLADIERKHIAEGTLAEGMSKDATLMAFGYPPDYMTPDLQHHIWKYWLKRSSMITVYFRNGRIYTTDPLLAGD